MKILAILFGFLNFGRKYRKKEQKYYKDRHRGRSTGIIFESVILSATPLLALWGAFELTWGDLALPKIFCIMLSLTIVYAPGELMVNGLIALRHALRVKAENKVKDTVFADIECENVADKRYVKKIGYKYDLVAGIISISLAVITVIAFITMAILYLKSLIIGLNG